MHKHIHSGKAYLKHTHTLACRLIIEEEDVSANISYIIFGLDANGTKVAVTRAAAYLKCVVVCVYVCVCVCVYVCMCN
jgi:hypothetical protein